VCYASKWSSIIRFVAISSIKYVFYILKLRFLIISEDMVSSTTSLNVIRLIVLVIIGVIYFVHFSNITTTTFINNIVAKYYQRNQIVVFTAWSRLDLSNDLLVKRLLSHQDYCNRHGYIYMVFTEELGSTFKSSFEVVKLKTYHPSLPAGWLKVYAFQHLLASPKFAQQEYLFYLDVDAIFFNVALPLYDVLSPHRQSIFGQISHHKGYLPPSHAIGMRNSFVSKTFVSSWIGLAHSCKNINMEQGAFYASIANMFPNCIGEKESPARNASSSIGTGSNITTTYLPRECVSKYCLLRQPYQNHLFNDCINSYLHECSSNTTEYLNLDHDDILLFKFISIHRPPSAGFGVHLDERLVNKKHSCPLTVHPLKDLSQEYAPNIDLCESRTGFWFALA
jgi:hypothetical protein